MTASESRRTSVSARLAMLPPVRDLSESRVLVSMVLGCVLTAVFYVVVIGLLFPGTYVAAAFTERGLIPYLTSFLCGTGIFLLVFSSLRILREENTFEVLRTVISQHSPLDRESAKAALKGVRKVREEYGGIVTNRFMRAVQTVKEGVHSKAALGDTLRGLGDIDQSIVDAAHLPLKYIIWLIPVLGFTGTVLGISSAISGFSGLIGGAADFAAAKGALSGVTVDLGVAFETTLLALIKTAVLMYGFSMLQKRERAFFINVDEYCADDMLAIVVPIPQPESDKTEIRQLTDAVVDLHDRLASWDPRFSETLDEHFKRLSELGGRIDATFERRKVEVFEGLRQLGGAADQRAAERVGEFQAQCDAFARAAGERVGEFRQHCDVFSEATADASSRGVGAAASMAESVERFATLTARVDELQSGLNHNIEALTQLEDFNRCLDALRDSTTTLPGVLRDLAQPRKITFVEAREEVREEIFEGARKEGVD